MLKPELGSECQLVPLILPALPVLPAGLCSECRVVFLRGADDVTLVLQQLQHLLQHGFTQAWAEAQAGTGQDVQEVAALLHVIWFLAFFLNDPVDLFVQFFVFSPYLPRAGAVNHRLVGKGQKGLHSFQFLLVKGLHSVLHKELFGLFTQQTCETVKVQRARIAAGGKFEQDLQKTINITFVPFERA